MSVVLRCPNCGTTRASAGECEACHEAEVRYFCTNHTPGRWLETGTCSTCGDRFGSPPRPRAVPAPAVREAPRAPGSTRPTAAAPVPTSSYPPPRLRDTRHGGAGRGPRGRAPEEEVAGASAGMPPWQKLLLSALRARYLSTRPMPGRARTTPRRRGGGCLKTLLVLFMFLFVVIAGAAFLFGRAFLQSLPD